MDYPGVLDGSMVSQFLLQPFLFDGIRIDGRTRVPLPVTTAEGIDFLTFYDEWLCDAGGKRQVTGIPSGESPCPAGSTAAGARSARPSRTGLVMDVSISIP